MVNDQSYYLSKLEDKFSFLKEHEFFHSLETLTTVGILFYFFKGDDFSASIKIPLSPGFKELDYGFSGMKNGDVVWTETGIWMKTPKWFLDLANETEKIYGKSVRLRKLFAGTNS